MPIPPELAMPAPTSGWPTDTDTIAGRPGPLRCRARVDGGSLGAAGGRSRAWPDGRAARRRASAALGPADSCDLIVDTHRLNRIVEHVPADFTVTVQAGVRLRDLERELAPARQSVALFPPRPAYAGTIGGLIATNAAGSHRYGFGTPRDRLTGITAVRADGTIVASADHAAIGGRDLVTLLAGSFGSLGLITEATFRLEPTPQISGGISLKCADPEHAERLVEEVSDPWIAPMGIDLRWPSADEQLRLLAMIQGDREDFEARWAGVPAGGPHGSAAYRPR